MHRDCSVPPLAIHQKIQKKHSTRPVPTGVYWRLPAKQGTGYVGSTVMCGGAQAEVGHYRVSAPGRGMSPRPVRQWPAEEPVLLRPGRRGEGGEGHAWPLGWGGRVLVPGSLPVPADPWLQQLRHCSATKGGVSGKGQGKGLLLHFKQGKYILVCKYIEKTACIPKFLEKSGQGGRLIRRPQGGGQSRPTVHQAAGKGGERDTGSRAGGWGKAAPSPVPW